MALLLAGLLDLGFAVFHALFWKLFGWPERLEASGSLNAAITQALNAMLIYVFTIYGSALLGFALAGAAVPPAFAWAGAGFWGLRLVIHPLLFSLRDRRSIAIALIFAAGAALHAIAGMRI